MKLVIWGTGRLTGKVVGQHVDIDNVYAFIDNNPSGKEYMGKPVIAPSCLSEMEYDAILVANLYSESIYKQCKELGVDLSKVIFLYSNCYLTDINKDYQFVRDVLGEEYAQIVKSRYHVVRGVEACGALCLKMVEGDTSTAIMCELNALN